MINRYTIVLSSIMLGALCGCSGGNSELPPDKDKLLRDNFHRALTAEEIAQMGKAGQKATEGAGRPQRTKG